MADKLKLLSKQDQSEFDHKYACWANNHRGWQKCKKKNRKVAKKRLRKEHRKEIEENEYENTNTNYNNNYNI